MVYLLHCSFATRFLFLKSEYECGPFIKSINFVCVCVRIFFSLSFYIWSFFPRTPLLRMSNVYECECECACVCGVIIVDPFLLFSNEMEWNGIHYSLEVQVPLFYSKSYSYYNPCMGYISVLFPLFPHTWHTPSTKCLGLSISMFTFKYPIKFVLCQIKDALDWHHLHHLLLHLYIAWKELK